LENRDDTGDSFTDGFLKVTICFLLWQPCSHPEDTVKGTGLFQISEICSKTNWFLQLKNVPSNQGSRSLPLFPHLL
jgi:hypothetical protein